jgi:hypothetical protein
LFAAIAAVYEQVADSIRNGMELVQSPIAQLLYSDP